MGKRWKTQLFCLFFFRCLPVYVLLVPTSQDSRSPFVVFLLITSRHCSQVQQREQHIFPGWMLTLFSPPSRWAYTCTFTHVPGNLKAARVHLWSKNSLKMELETRPWADSWQNTQQMNGEPDQAVPGHSLLWPVCFGLTVVTSPMIAEIILKNLFHVGIETVSFCNSPA